MKRIRRGLMVLVLLQASLPCIAYEWHARGFATDERNIVMTPLIAAFRFHAEAAASWYIGQLNGSTVSRAKFERFSVPFVGSTFGAFEYTYLRDGVRKSRIYYAMSGREEPFTSLPPATVPMANLIAQDSTRIHAYLSPQDVTTLVPSEVEGDHAEGQHRRDAELKALRTIERDIRRGVVTRNGRLQAFISQPMCDSCEHLMHRFGALYDVDINVNYLEGDMSVAYRQFRLMMARYMDTILAHVRHPGGPGEPTPPTGGSQCAEIFAQ
jgi:hypothetical protein